MFVDKTISQQFYDFNKWKVTKNFYPSKSNVLWNIYIMNFEYTSFELELKEKTKSTFIGCTEKLDVKDIVGFALYSDNSAMTMSVSCNTYEHLKKTTN